MRALIRLACLLCAALSLAACAPLLALVGTNTTAVQVTAQVERVKLAGDGASYAASNKTITDHALSVATGKECKIFNVLNKESVCKEKSETEKAGKTAVANADPDAQPKADTSGESAATPQTQATAKRNSPAIDFSRDQASGD